MVLKPAAVGVGEKGQGYSLNPVSTYVGAIWSVQERLAFGLAEDALQKFKAESPDGRGPKTNDEYMKKIIGDNHIKLPKLPEGQEYQYDPDTEKLMVRQPE